MKKIILISSFLFILSFSSFVKEPRPNDKQMQCMIIADGKSTKDIWFIYPIVGILLFYSYKKEFAK